MTGPVGVRVRVMLWVRLRVRVRVRVRPVMVTGPGTLVTQISVEELLHFSGTKESV